MQFSRPGRPRPRLAGLASLAIGLGLAGACAAQSYRATDPDVYHGAYLSWASKAPAHKPPPVAPQRQAPSAYNYRPAAVYQRSAAPPDIEQAGGERADYQQAPQGERTEFHIAASAPTREVVQPRPSAAGPTAAFAVSRHGDDVGVRYYSLHRDYGMAPDPIPAPAPHNMVLIGPPEHAPNVSGDDAGDDSGKTAKQRHSGDDDDDGGSGGDRP